MTLTALEVKKLIMPWKKILGLHPEWQILIKVNNDERDEKKNMRKNAAYIVVQSGYHQANLTVNAFNIRPKDLEETLVHELCHIHLDPLQTFMNCAGAFEEVITDIVEAATCRLSRAFVRAKKYSLYTPRKRKTK